MHVFIGWSGPRSKEMAEALHGWLPRVIQALKPWMSELDIPKGGNWRTVLKESLKEAGAGIICLTPENLESPYVLFECGFLSADEGRLVCPYLLGLEKTDVQSPLADLQLTKADRDETYRMLCDLNKVQDQDRALDKDVLEDAFKTYWIELDRQLQEIARKNPQTRKPLGIQALLKEILVTVRSISRTVVASEEKLGAQKARMFFEEFLKRVEREAEEDARKLVDDVQIRKVEEILREIGNTALDRRTGSADQKES